MSNYIIISASNIINAWVKKLLKPWIACFSFFFLLVHVSTVHPWKSCKRKKNWEKENWVTHIIEQASSNGTQCHTNTYSLYGYRLLQAWLRCLTEPLLLFFRAFPHYKAYETPIYFKSDWLNEFWDQRMDVTDDYRFVYMGPKGSWWVHSTQ